MEQMAKQQEARGVSIPVPQWWLDAIGRAREGLTNIRLAELVSVDSGQRYDDSQISRCINPSAARRVSTLDLVDALSDLLDVPRPFWIAENEDEAVRFRSQRKLTFLHSKKSEMQALAKKLRNRKQPGTIQLVHGGETPKGGQPGTMDPGRRKTPPG